MVVDYAKLRNRFPKLVINGSDITIPHEGCLLGVFPYQVEPAPIFDNPTEKDECGGFNSCHLALSIRDRKDHPNRTYQSCSFDGDELKPVRAVARVKHIIHPYLSEIDGQVVGLSKRNNRELINPKGQVLAVFKEEVHPYWIKGEQGRLVALSLKDNCTIIGEERDNQRYKPFERPVKQNIIYEGNGLLTALSQGWNGLEFNDPVQAIEQLNIEMVHFGGEVGGETGRILKIGKYYVGLNNNGELLRCNVDWEKGTSTDHGLSYGKFFDRVHPESLSVREHMFMALDQGYSRLVYGLYQIKSIGRDVTSEGVNESDIRVSLPLEQLLKQTK